MDMFNFLFILIIAAFIAMLFVNIFFRVKIFKVYKYLVQNRVQFDSSHFFNRKKLQEEIISKFPQHQKEIESFIGLIHQSVQLASVLIIIIIAFGFLLMRYR
jgi:hypothetical protein